MGLEQRKWIRMAAIGLSLGLGAAPLAGCDTIIPALSSQVKQEGDTGTTATDAEATDLPATETSAEASASDAVWVDMTPSPPESESPAVAASVAPTSAPPSDPTPNAALQPGGEVPPLVATSAAPGEIPIPGDAIVIASSLNVRMEPDSKSEIVWGLFANAHVKVIEDAGEWYRIRVGDVIGYVKKEFLAPSDGQLKPTTETIAFYDDVAGAFKSVEKSFYWVIYGGNPRRFDGKLPAQCFEYDKSGTLLVSNYVKDIAKKMGRALYQSDVYSVNCYFGQYYPSAKKEDGTVYETGIHEGIDFGGPALDSTFYALTDGEVIAVNDSNDNKEYAWIAVETDGHTVFYIHQRRSYVNVGDKVKKGDRLGDQGDIGAPGASHVHVAVSKGRTETFARSKDTELTDDPPYEFWKNQGY